MCLESMAFPGQWPLLGALSQQMQLPTGESVPAWLIKYHLTSVPCLSHKNLTMKLSLSILFISL
jgi:hypothetical protein